MPGRGARRLGGAGGGAVHTRVARVLRAPSADGGGATWAAVLASRATATAQVLGTYPGAGPGPGQRLYVRAALDVTAERPPGQPAARRRITMVVDVVAVGGGRWLVGWAR